MESSVAAAGTPRASSGRWRRLRQNRRGDPAAGPSELATLQVLRALSLAAAPLRVGLTGESARKALRRLVPLIGASALCLYGEDGAWAWDGQAADHAAIAAMLADQVFRSGRPQTVGPDQLACGAPSCPLRHAVMVPIMVDGQPTGVLAAFAPTASASLARTTAEVASWVAGQLELAELDRLRVRLAEAEVRALRAQISPHFVYNALTTIASFVRTDPDRARELLLEFADFTRYSFRQHGDYTSLADELRSIEQYLTLERARFGDRLTVTLRIAPEVLTVVVPFLCLQPLVENAVQHGLARKSGGGRVSIMAEDAAGDALIIIEDDGLGMDPAHAARVLADGGSSSGVGMSNVDERLRQLYGDEYGLVVETAIGAGTKISVRIPKYRADIQPGPPRRLAP